MTDRDFQKARVEVISTGVYQLAAILKNAQTVRGLSGESINSNIVKVITEVFDEGMLLALKKMQ